METIDDDPIKRKLARDKNDATRPFDNCENENAPEINKAGDARTRNYMNLENQGIEGPNWTKMSRDIDGPTGPNAGIFK